MDVVKVLEEAEAASEKKEEVHAYHVFRRLRYFLVAIRLNQASLPTLVVVHYCLQKWSCGSEGVVFVLAILSGYPEMLVKFERNRADRNNDDHISMMNAHTSKNLDPPMRIHC